MTVDKRASAQPGIPETDFERKCRVIYEAGGPTPDMLEAIADNIVFLRPLKKPATRSSGIHLAGQKENPFVSDVYEVVRRGTEVFNAEDPLPVHVESGDLVIVAVPQLLKCREDLNLFFIKAQYIVAKLKADL